MVDSKHPLQYLGNKLRWGGRKQRFLGIGTPAPFAISEERVLGGGCCVLKRWQPRQLHWIVSCFGCCHCFLCKVRIPHHSYMRFSYYLNLHAIMYSLKAHVYGFQVICYPRKLFYFMFFQLIIGFVHSNTYPL